MPLLFSSNTPPRSRSSSDLSGVYINHNGRYLNGWTKEQEELMAEWADQAGCYHWLHDRCQKKFSRYNMAMTLPVIVMSTLTGTANFAITGLVGDDPKDQKYAQTAIGAVSLIAGILSTVQNFFRFAQSTESHRVAGIAWGKFHRQIAVELAIPPHERIDSMDFLKICRAELDRLIEQSPPISDEVCDEFEKEYKNSPLLKKPEICSGLEHTRIFKDHASRFRQITAEATLAIYHKKRMLREEIIPDIKEIVSGVLEKKILDMSKPMTTQLRPSGEEETTPTQNEEWRKLLYARKTIRPLASPKPTEEEVKIVIPEEKPEDKPQLSAPEVQEDKGAE